MRASRTSGCCTAVSLRGRLRATLIAKAPADPVPAKSFGAEVPLHPEFNATPDYVRSVSGGLNKSAVLVDVRKLEEFEGKTNPYPFFTRKGRIPGASVAGRLGHPCEYEG